MGERHQSQLFMVREELVSLPAIQLPESYKVRSLRQGDEQEWERIIRASFGGDHDFAKGMAADEAYRPERVYFVCDGSDVPIASASAWYRPQWSEDTGYLHMVGLIPEHSGKGLGYQVSLAALMQMLHEGRTRAVLHTDDFRIPAIKTYLKLGFLPELADTDHLDRWQALSHVIGKPITVIQPNGVKFRL